MRKPIRVLYSVLSGRFYATSHYRQEKDGIIVITGEKYDVTNDIGFAVTNHDIEFSAVKPNKKKKKATGVRIQRLPGDVVRTKSAL